MTIKRIFPTRTELRRQDAASGGFEGMCAICLINLTKWISIIEECFHEQMRLRICLSRHFGELPLRLPIRAKESILQRCDALGGQIWANLRFDHHKVIPYRLLYSRLQLISHLELKGPSLIAVGWSIARAWSFCSRLVWRRLMLLAWVIVTLPLPIQDE